MLGTKDRYNQKIRTGLRAAAACERLDVDGVDVQDSDIAGAYSVLLVRKLADDCRPRHLHVRRERHATEVHLRF